MNVMPTQMPIHQPYDCSRHSSRSKFCIWDSLLCVLWCIKPFHRYHPSAILRLSYTRADHDSWHHNWSKSCNRKGMCISVYRLTVDSPWLLMCNRLLDTNANYDSTALTTSIRVNKLYFPHFMLRENLSRLILIAFHTHNKIHLYKTVCHQMLVFLSDTFIRNQMHDGIIINNGSTFFSWTANRFGTTIICDFNRQILTPTVFTIFVAAHQIKCMLYLVNINEDWIIKFTARSI